MATLRLFVACLALASVVPEFVSANLSHQPPPQRSEPGGLRLLHQLQDALGGAKRIAAVRDFEETIRAEAWDGNGGSLGEVRKRTRWLRTPTF